MEIENDNDVPSLIEDDDDEEDECREEEKGDGILDREQQEELTHYPNKTRSGRTVIPPERYAGIMALSARLGDVLDNLPRNYNDAMNSDYQQK